MSWHIVHSIDLTTGDYLGMSVFSEPTPTADPRRRLMLTGPGSGPYRSHADAVEVMNTSRAFERIRAICEHQTGSREGWYRRAAGPKYIGPDGALRALRECAGYTAVDVATILGVTADALDRIESGDATIETARRLCLIYGCPLAAAFLEPGVIREKMAGVQWTRVDDGLPPVGDRVLVWSRHLGVQVAHRIWEYIGNHDVRQAFSMGPVTHWRRLPEPPEGVET